MTNMGAWRFILFQFFCAYPKQEYVMQNLPVWKTKSYFLCAVA